jgi:hypothetical protein
MNPGDKVAYTIKAHRRAGTVLKTSEGIFKGFVGKQSALIEFTKPDGSKLLVKVLVSKLNHKGEA